MSEALIAAVISAFVALVTSSITAFIAWFQIQREKDKFQQEIQRERIKWLADIKLEQHIELYKSRLQFYPEILTIIGDLSNRSPTPLTHEKTQRVAKEINDWIYSSGGLIASGEARGALIALRETCISWKGGHLTNETRYQLYGFRNAVILLLRRDIDIKGLETYDFNNLKSVLEELNEEISSLR